MYAFSVVFSRFQKWFTKLPGFCNSESKQWKLLQQFASCRSTTKRQTPLFVAGLREETARSITRHLRLRLAANERKWKRTNLITRTVSNHKSKKSSQNVIIRHSAFLICYRILYVIVILQFPQHMDLLTMCIKVMKYNDVFIDVAVLAFSVL